jgi:hypothetical protein
MSKVEMLGESPTASGRQARPLSPAKVEVDVTAYKPRGN